MLLTVRFLHRFSKFVLFSAGKVGYDPRRLLPVHSEHIRSDPLHPNGVGRRHCWVAWSVHHCLYVLLLCEYQLPLREVPTAVVWVPASVVWVSAAFNVWVPAILFCDYLATVVRVPGFCGASTRLLLCEYQLLLYEYLLLLCEHQRLLCEYPASVVWAPTSVAWAPASVVWVAKVPVSVVQDLLSVIWVPA